MSATTFDLIWLVGLAIVAIIQLVAARQQTKWRTYRPGRQVFRAIWTILGFGLIVYIGGVPLNLVWAIVFGVVGAVLGFVTGRFSKTGTAKGRLVLRRAPYAPWIVAIAYIAAFAFLLFGSSALYSVGLLLVLFAVMMNDGAIVGEIVVAGRAPVSTAAA